VGAKPDFYKLLTVNRAADPEEIKKAFRKKAMLYHPDRNPGKEEWANAKLTGIIEAYEVLSDPDRRRVYDHRLACAEKRRLRKSGTDKSTSQYMVDIMRFKAAPAWVRTAAFLYVFFENYSKETKRIK